MIEVTILNHLKSKLDVPVFLEKPEPLVPKYVLFEKTGGRKNSHLLSSTFAFQSYAESMYEASSLNDLVKIAVESLTDLSDVSGVSLNADYNFTDVTTKQYRYQALFDINHY